VKEIFDVLYDDILENIRYCINLVICFYSLLESSSNISFMYLSIFHRIYDQGVISCWEIVCLLYEKKRPHT